MTKQASVSVLALPINAVHPRFTEREMRLVPADHLICVIVDDEVFMASRIHMAVGQRGSSFPIRVVYILYTDG